MASIVSLLSDNKTVYHIDNNGNRTELSLSATHGVNFSLNGSEIEAEEATSAATGSLEASIEVGVMDWSLSFHVNGSNKTLRLVGVDAVDMGIKMDQRTIDLTAGDYNLKSTGTTIEIKQV